MNSNKNNQNVNQIQHSNNVNNINTAININGHISSNKKNTSSPYFQQ